MVRLICLAPAPAEMVWQSFLACFLGIQLEEPITETGVAQMAGASQRPFLSQLHVQGCIHQKRAKQMWRLH